MSDDRQLADAAEQLIDAALVKHYDARADESFIECRMCRTWEGHHSRCPIPLVEDWLQGKMR